LLQNVSAEISTAITVSTSPNVIQRRRVAAASALAAALDSGRGELSVTAAFPPPVAGAVKPGPYQQ